MDGVGGEGRSQAGLDDCGRPRWHGGLCFHFRLYGFLFSGPAAVGDTGLYYVWRDEGCLTADKQGRGVFYNYGSLSSLAPSTPSTVIVAALALIARH